MWILYGIYVYYTIYVYLYSRCVTVHKLKEVMYETLQNDVNILIQSFYVHYHFYKMSIKIPLIGTL